MYKRQVTGRFREGQEPVLALPLGCTGVGLGVGTGVAVDSGLLSAAGFDGLLLEPVDGFSTLDLSLIHIY